LSLSGTFTTISLTDLLQWLSHARKSGTLCIHGERYSKKIYIREGKIISSASDDPTDHLGHFLLRQGKIDEAQLRSAIETQQHTRAMLGKILVTVGVIEEKDLLTALVQKAEETIFGLFLWPDARFEFLDGELPSRVAVPLNLSIEDVLLKGGTWYDDLRRVRAAFGSSRTIMMTTGRDLDASIAPSDSLPRRIFDLVDGRRSIHEICLQTHASEFVVGTLLHLLYRQGFLAIRQRVAAEEQAPRKTFSGLLDEARSLLRTGEAQEALKVLAEAHPLSPQDAELHRLRGEAQTLFQEQVARDGVRPDRIPVVIKPLESLTGEALTPEEVFILSRVNGSWDIRSIVSICPFPEAEALLRIKGLAEREILQLQDPE